MEQSRNRQGMLKHGMYKSRIYRIWQNMRQRCSNSKAPTFKYYGGKGVTVCQEWDSSFESFMNWAFHSGYADDLTIDRIKSDEGYYPNNCRWITKAENTRRASTGHKGKPSAGRPPELFEYNGKKQSLQDWSKELGITYITLYKRINDYKWTVERAFNKQVKAKGR